MSEYTPSQSSIEIPYGYCHCGCGEWTPLAATTRPENGWIKGQPIHYIRGHGRRLRKTLTESFSRYFVQGDPGECWEWQGVCSWNGYGRFSHKGSSYQASRVAWELHHGESIPEGLFACHSCDNRKCVNPHHIWIGTRQDNVDDMVKKGRQTRGVVNSKAILTDEDVREIRRQAAAGVNYTELGKQYGVKPNVISQTARGISWSHLTGDWVDKRRPAKSLTVDQVHAIRNLAANGLSCGDISRQLDIPNAIVWFVFNGHSYRNV